VDAVERRVEGKGAGGTAIHSCTTDTKLAGIYPASTLAAVIKSRAGVCDDMAVPNGIDLGASRVSDADVSTDVKQSKIQSVYNHGHLNKSIKMEVQYVQVGRVPAALVTPDTKTHAFPL
jgi:hypothetical protein